MYSQQVVKYSGMNVSFLQLRAGQLWVKSEWRMDGYFSSLLHAQTSLEIRSAFYKMNNEACSG